MDIGDIIYFLVMLGAIVFGIFNDYKKKQQKADTSTPPKNKSEYNLGDVIREIFQESGSQKTPPPAPVKQKKTVIPKAVPAVTARPEFKSSLDLVTDFEGESSLKGHIFNQQPFESQIQKETAKTVHPLLQQLKQGGSSEIRRAVIYSEILQKKY